MFICVEIEHEQRGKREVPRERENLEQAPYPVQSPTQGSIT